MSPHHGADECVRGLHLLRRESHAARDRHVGGRPGHMPVDVGISPLQRLWQRYRDVLLAPGADAYVDVLAVKLVKTRRQRIQVHRLLSTYGIKTLVDFAFVCHATSSKKSRPCSFPDDPPAPLQRVPPVFETSRLLVPSPSHGRGSG